MLDIYDHVAPGRIVSFAPEVGGVVYATANKVLYTAGVTEMTSWLCVPPPRLDCTDVDFTMIWLCSSAIVLYIGMSTMGSRVGYRNP